MQSQIIHNVQNLILVTTIYVFGLKKYVHISCQIKLFRMIPIDQMFNYWLMSTFFMRFRA